MQPATRPMSVSETGRIAPPHALTEMNGNLYEQIRAPRSRMRKNVLGFPAGKIKFRPRRQKVETGLRKLGAALARQHRIQLFAQRMQMQHIGGGIGELRLAERRRAPVARLDRKSVV